MLDATGSSVATSSPPPPPPAPPDPNDPTASRGDFDSALGANGVEPAGSTSGGPSTGGTASQSAADAVDTARATFDADESIGRLNSDGDQVAMSLTGEAKALVPVPIGDVPVGLGGKGQYGYDITVTQVGDSQTPGVPDDANVNYEVTFDKNLLAGVQAEPPVPGIDVAGELNFRTADSVTMTFATREDAARAVRTLQRVAAAETLRDAGSIATPGPSTDNPASNPIDPSGSGSSNGGGPVPASGSGLPNPADPIAQRLEPSAEDMAFLHDHITSYSTSIGTQERLKLSASLSNFGIEPRFDGNQEIIRTVELPHGNEPGRLTYTIAGEFDSSTKEKFTVGVKNFDQLDVGYIPQNIVDHGTLRGEISLSWELDPAAMTGGSSASGSGALPEAGILRDGQWATPDAMSVKLDLQLQDQPLADLSRTDMRHLTVEATMQDPTTQAGRVLDGLLAGDLSGASRQLGANSQITATSEFVRRDGVSQQHDIGFEVADLFEAKVSMLGEFGVNDVVDRQSVTLGGTRPPDQPEVPPETTPEPPSDQLVVVPREGLNVRSGPSIDAPKDSAFYHGTFVDPTGNRQADARGQEWIEVVGRDVNGHEIQGWVAADHVAPHPEGAMGPTGRINPELQQQGYQAHTVKPGDTLWDIAQREGVDFRGTVALNSDHIIDPNLIFPGDTIYIPGTATPQPAPPEPADPPPPDAGSSESTPSAPSSPSAPSQPAPSAPSAPSGDAGSGSGSGSSGSGPVTGPTPPPGEPRNPTRVDGRPSLEDVLRDYQVADDEMVDWSPQVEVGGIDIPFSDRVTDLAGFSQRVTATEARLLDRLSMDQVMEMRDIRDRAFSGADQHYAVPSRDQFPAGDVGDAQYEAARFHAQNDGHNDAFRHAYLSALLTKHFGESYARDVATAHEGVPGNEADREAMDLYNNELGRRIAQENPNASDEELAALVYDAVQNGEAIVIDGNGNLAWSDEVAFGAHGTANDPAGQGGMRPEGNAEPTGS